jgi:hypothetical protein
MALSRWQWQPGSSYPYRLLVPTPMKSGGPLPTLVRRFVSDMKGASNRSCGVWGASCGSR